MSFKFLNGARTSDALYKIILDSTLEKMGSQIKEISRPLFNQVCQEVGQEEGEKKIVITRNGVVRLELLVKKIDIYSRPVKATIQIRFPLFVASEIQNKIVEKICERVGVKPDRIESEALEMDIALPPDIFVFKVEIGGEEAVHNRGRAYNGGFFLSSEVTKLGLI
jgi:hypothetical protein